ncbi:MAG: response regulator [Nitrospirae bacterium]|nr:response regulator [Nitrospirota bacterium]
MAVKVLIVDDDVALATQLKWFLPKKYVSVLAHTAEDALAFFCNNGIDIVLLDLGLPPYENTPEVGLKLLNDMLAAKPGIKIVVVTGQKERNVAVKAISQGAFDYLMKPVGESKLVDSLKRAEFFADIESDIPAEEKSIKINPQSLNEGFETLKEDMKKHIIIEALQKTENNVSKTARLLGLRRTSVYYYINKYNLRTRDQ